HPHPHDPRVAGRRAESVVCDDGDRERSHAREGDLPPCAEERADSGHHDHRAAIRIAADGRDHHRADLLLAGTRPPADSVHQHARLSAGAGIDTRDRADLHLRELRIGSAVRRRRSADQARMKRLLRNFAFTSGALLTIVLIVTALAAPLLAPFDPNAQDTFRRLEPPSREHLLGLDDLGRDVLSRILFGARVSLRVGFSVVILASVIGIALGAMAGYFGGAVDTIVMRITDILLAFPGILLAIALVAVLGPSLNNVVLALATIGWVGYARLVRGQVLKVREMEFVTAAKALGARSPRVIILHVLPNVINPVIVMATLGLAGAILAEA